MKSITLFVLLMASVLVPNAADAQRPICIDGQCQLPRRPFRFRAPRFRFLQRQQYEESPQIDEVEPEEPPFVLKPVLEDVFLTADDLEPYLEVSDGDRLEQVVRATVRVTVNGACGSGTIVGKDSAGNALVLTNAHVAGTTRGRRATIQRWDSNGDSERGVGKIIAAGYGRGLSVDFALLKCEPGFAQDVTPIPLADRYPAPDVMVTNYGCPRCEWPSLQVLKLKRSEGQILRWQPEAIGGRSGSSLIDYTDNGPRVVGLLTWAGGGDGLGQSTPFLLDAMQGQLPKSLEPLPDDVFEVQSDSRSTTVWQVPATTGGDPLAIPVWNTELSFQSDQSLIDSITEKPKPEVKPNSDDDSKSKPGGDVEDTGILDRDRSQPGPIARGLQWIGRLILTLLFVGAAGVIGFLAGRFIK